MDIVARENIPAQFIVLTQHLYLVVVYIHLRCILARSQGFQRTEIVKLYFWQVRVIKRRGVANIALTHEVINPKAFCRVVVYENPPPRVHSEVNILLLAEFVCFVQKEVITRHTLCRLAVCIRIEKYPRPRFFIANFAGAFKYLVCAKGSRVAAYYILCVCVATKPSLLLRHGGYVHHYTLHRTRQKEKRQNAVCLSGPTTTAKDESACAIR